MKKFVCAVCGYVHEGEELPDDFICPICKHPASDFEKITHKNAQKLFHQKSTKTKMVSLLPCFSFVPSAKVIGVFFS